MATHGVSITVPEPFGAQLSQARSRCGDPCAEAIPPHITLLPPTDIGADDLVAFEAHLGEIAASHDAFTMVLSGTGTFRPISPVVFVQVSSGISQCEMLERAVRSGPVERALEFNYHPHVTIAHNVSEQQLDAAFEDLAQFRCTFAVESFELFRQGANGHWNPLSSFRLRA